MLANMLSKLLMTLCLVALTTCIDYKSFSILETLGLYPSDRITVSSKVQSADLYLFNGPGYYIPDGECLGHIDTTRLCGEEPLKGIEVRVSDPYFFVNVKIQQKRGEVRILRRSHPKNGSLLYCSGVALVDLRLTCDHWQFSHSRNRARLPSLLDSDSESSESSESSDSTSSVEDTAEDEDDATAM